MVHANAPLSELGRLRLARCIVEDGWPISRAAERFQVSGTTAIRWAGRYRQSGAGGVRDRSSRPAHGPNRTRTSVVRKIVHHRTKKRLGPVQIAALVGVAPSTVHRVLTRCGRRRLAWLDRATGTPVRYECPDPGGLVHVDVKKLGNIPAGGGWRFQGRAKGKAYRIADPGRARSRDGPELIGHSFIPAAVDDPPGWPTARYTTTRPARLPQRSGSAPTPGSPNTTSHSHKVLTDNGGCYRSFLWRDTLAHLDVKHLRTRPYRPQTNGKVCERFNRTMLNEWAHQRLFTSEQTRRAALPSWLHRYNHHRPHTALGGQPPISRTNVSGQNT